MRRGTIFTIRNFLITGMRQGFQISDANTLAQVDNGTSQMGAGASWANVSNMHASVTTPYITNGRFPDVRVGVDPNTAGISATGCSGENPVFQPSSVATLAGGQLPPIQPPNDGFFQAVTFIGAVPPPPGDDWTRGWTNFAAR